MKVQTFLIMFMMIFPLSFHHLCSADETTAVAKDSKRKTVWNRKMQELYSTLSRLLLNLSSEERFVSAANEKQVSTDTRKLSELAHDISSITRNGKTSSGEKISAPDPDPTLPLVSHLFDKDAKRAYLGFKSGHKKYSRQILRSVTNYCVACHTRSGTQPDFIQMKEPDGFKTLSSLEKADFYAATRQFDKALSLLAEIASNEQILSSKPFEWEKALEYALIISVRVKDNPDAAIDILNTALKRKNLTTFLKNDIINWKKSLDDWKAEGGRLPNSEEGYHNETIRLITAARSAQKYPADHAGDIYYYRASSVAHQQLSKYPQGRYAPQGQLLLGIAYEALGDLNIWSLHEMYYESCIRQSPHTETALGCYNHLEKSMFIGYSGSGGISIPSEERKKLDELREIAGPRVEKKL